MKNTKLKEIIYYLLVFVLLLSITTLQAFYDTNDNYFFIVMVLCGFTGYYVKDVYELFIK